MREFLFRGANGYKAPYSWYYGSLNTKCLTEIITDSEWDVLTRYQVNDNTVGQFTGLYDSTKWEDLSELEQQEWLKNHTKDEWRGKRIFEGDIVKFGKYCGYINYNHSSFCVKHDEINNPAIDLITIRSELKVIGNIYDNPELIVT